jgi:secretion/DNA translocation related TadE-like protein
VWVLAFGFVFILAGGAGAAVGAATVARHRAQVAADMGALAGAMHVIEGEAVACAEAGALVVANGGRLMACRTEVLDIVVTADVDVTGVPGFIGSASATARAGPIGA